MEIPTGPKVPMAPPGAATPYVRVDANPDAFGLNIDKARADRSAVIMHASDIAAAHAIKFQELRNQTEVDDVYTNQFSPAFRKQYQEYYSLQGKEALDKMPEYIKSMEALEKDTSSGFKNDQQRHLFRQTARRRVQMELDGMARYADQQNKVWMAQTSDAFLRNQQDQAADFYNDEQKFGAALGTGLAEIDRYGTSTGQSSEVMRDRASKFVSEAFVGRISRAMVDNPREANKIYRDNQQLIDAKVRPQIEAHLNSALKPIEAREIADDIVDKNPAKAVDVRAMLVPWTKAAEEQAQKSRPDDPVFRDLVVGRVQHYVNAYATAQAAQERSDRNMLMGIAAGTGDPASRPTTIEALLADPEAKTAWSRLDNFSQTALLSRLELNSKRQDVPVNAESLGVYYKLKGMQSTDREGFANTNLMEYVNKVPHSLFHELVQQQTAMATKEARDQDKALRVQHALSIARPSLLAAGVLDPKAKPGTTKAATYDQFVGRYTQQLEQFITNNKRGPNDRELQDITNSLLTSGAQSGSGWLYDTKTRAFQVEPGQFYVPVPKSEKAKIREEYRTMKGVEPSDATVTQIYTLHQLKKGAK